MTTKKHALFLAKFPSLLKDWSEQQKKNGKLGSQKEFARQVGVPAHYVTDWKSGRWKPDEYMDDICRVLGVDPKAFEPTTRQEKWESSEIFVTEQGRRNVEFAKARGLDLDLVRALSQEIDFDDLFPKYLPVSDRKNCVLPGKRTHGDSAPIDSDLSFLQIKRDGKTITLHVCDLMFLKEVQDQVADFVSYLFYKRSKEMEKETQKANDEILKIPQDLPAGQRTLTIMEILKKSDRFWSVFEDWQRANTRKATQEDIDRFFDGGAKLDDGGVADTKKEGK